MSVHPAMRYFIRDILCEGQQNMEKFCELKVGHFDLAAVLLQVEDAVPVAVPDVARLGSKVIFERRRKNDRCFTV